MEYSGHHVDAATSLHCYIHIYSNAHMSTATLEKHSTWLWYTVILYILWYTVKYCSISSVCYAYLS